MSSTKIKGPVICHVLKNRSMAENDPMNILGSNKSVDEFFEVVGQVEFIKAVNWILDFYE